MIDIKTPQEIELMKKGGKILAEVLFELCDTVKPGMTELEIDSLAEKLIVQKGGEVAFKRVEGYHHTICASTNDVVVHGIPSNYVYKPGDVVGIDCGVYYKGYFTDMAETIKLKAKSEKRKTGDEVDKFLRIGKEALEEAIKQAVIGNRIGHISKTIQQIVEGNGYSVVRSLIGHGVGKNLHEEPEVPGYLAGSIAKTPELVEGMTIAIEVIYNMGKRDVIYAGDDGWTIKTRDGSMSGVFERTVCITKDGPRVLTA
jgi:methionyl aminopeptidase